MDSNTIRSILERYWEGETSLKEEDLLREYFNQDNVPKEFESVQPMFRFFKKEQEAYLNGGFEERLSSKLKIADDNKPKARSLTVYIRRVAAVAAIFIGILFFINKMNVTHPVAEDMAMQQELNVEEKAQAKLAYAEAKAALLLVSRKLKKGTAKAEEGISQVRKATKVIR